LENQTSVLNATEKGHANTPLSERANRVRNAAGIPTPPITLSGSDRVHGLVEQLRKSNARNEFPKD